jgi:hypothetical protein
MLRLNMASGPRWYDLGHGVRVECVALTSGLVAAANADPRVKDLPADVHPDVRWHAFIKSVASLCITDWDGVGGADGQPLPVTQDAVGVLMDLFAISNQFAAVFITPTLLLAEEKKAFAPLPNGSSEGAQDTAKTAPASVPNAHVN